MSASHHVVLSDPEGQYWEGALVETPQAMVLRARGAVTLPTEAALVSRSALGGWVKRAWGAGYPLSTNTPKMTCPLVFHAARIEGGGGDWRRLYAAFRLVPEGQANIDYAKDGGRFAGQLRLAGDTGQPHAGGVGLFEPTILGAESLGDLDEDGGWTKYLDASLNVSSDGFISVALYGAIPGLAVAWAAVSQSR